MSLATGGAAAASQQVVLGAQRGLFFHRPILPALSTLPAAAVLERGAVDPLQPPSERDGAAARTVGVQTDFRESEAQTDPYSGDYVVPAGDEPAVLLLRNLRFGDGLPARTAADLTRIDRIRKRAAMERALPPMTDDAAFGVRQQMMQELEEMQWRDRESDLAVAQEERLAKLSVALAAREDETTQMREERLQMTRHERDVSLDENLVEIQRKRVQAIRKLSTTRQQLAQVAMTEENKRRRDIVGEYADFGSKVYAPVARVGVASESRVGNVEDVTHRLTQTADGLFELSRSLKRSERGITPQKLASRAMRFTQTRSTMRSLHSELGAGTSSAAASQKSRVPANASRKAREVLGDLERVASSLTGQRGVARQRAPPKSRQAVDQPVQRPQTPIVAEPPACIDARERAVLFLQRILRGRAVQNTMFIGKEKRLALLDELRLSFSPREALASEAAVAAEALLGSVSGALVSSALAREFGRAVAPLEHMQVAEVQRRAAANAQVRPHDGEQLLSARSEDDGSAAGAAAGARRGHGAAAAAAVSESGDDGDDELDDGHDSGDGAQQPPTSPHDNVSVASSALSGDDDDDGAEGVVERVDEGEVEGAAYGDNDDDIRGVAGKGANEGDESDVAGVALGDDGADDNQDDDDDDDNDDDDDGGDDGGADAEQASAVDSHAPDALPHVESDESDADA